MLAKNHKIVTGATVFFLTGHIVPAMMAMLGSTFPDRIEGLGIWLPWHLKHRKNSHYWVFYAILVLICYYFAYQKFLWHMTPHQTKSLLISLAHSSIHFNFEAFIASCLGWFFIGALLHLVEDFFCGGVPILSRKRRYGLRLFHVGSRDETIVSYVSMLLLLLFYFEKFNGAVFIF